MPADLSKLKPIPTTPSGGAKTPTTTKTTTTATKSGDKSTKKTTSTGGSQKFDMSGFDQMYQYLLKAMPQTEYPESIPFPSYDPYPGGMTQDEFMSMYDTFRQQMGGDDATLKANLEAAMRPMYDQSIAELDRARRAGNADIDVDAYSRGMGDSTWVTDAKLRNLRNTENNIANLNANYNSQLYGNLMNAMQTRDANALNNAWAWAQMQNQDRLNEWNAKREDALAAWQAANQDRLNAWQTQQSALQSAFQSAWSYWNANRKSGSGKGSSGLSMEEAIKAWEKMGGSGSGVPPVSPVPGTGAKQTREQVRPQNYMID